MRGLVATGVALLTALGFVGSAGAAGGHYVFVGGSEAAQTAVRSARRRVRAWLGGEDWCCGDPELEHDDHACERFASSLAWAFWAQPRNIMAVHTVVSKAEFRDVLPSLLGLGEDGLVRQGLPSRRSSPTLRQAS